MDFENLAGSLDEIKLSDLDKQKIIENCKKEKRRKPNGIKAFYAVAAVIAICLIVPFAIALMPASKSNDEMLFNEEKYCYENKFSAMGTDTSASNEMCDGLTGEEYFVGAPSNEMNFRDEYYFIPDEFRSLVDEEDYDEWIESIKPDDTMPLAAFVEHFGITREEFELANRSFTLANGGFEVYDPDIIYSFDMQLIKDFYSMD